MPFVNRITKRAVNDTGVLLVEGGIPEWEPALEQAKAEHRTRLARAALRGDGSKGGFVRRAVREDEQHDTRRISAVLGGLPDWRNTDENVQIARREYEQRERERERDCN